MVHDLLYYSDTVRFFEAHKHEINILFTELFEAADCRSFRDLCEDFDDSDPLCLEQHNQSLATWIGFEETTRQIADELGIEI